MRKAGLAALLLGAALWHPGCGLRKAQEHRYCYTGYPYSDSNPYPGGNTYSQRQHLHLRL